MLEKAFMASKHDSRRICGEERKERERICKLSAAAAASQSEFRLQISMSSFEPSSVSVSRFYCDALIKSHLFSSLTNQRTKSSFWCGNCCARGDNYVCMLTVSWKAAAEVNIGEECFFRSLLVACRKGRALQNISKVDYNFKRRRMREETHGLARFFSFFLPSQRRLDSDGKETQKLDFSFNVCFLFIDLLCFFICFHLAIMWDSTRFNAYIHQTQHTFELGAFREWRPMVDPQPSTSAVTCHESLLITCTHTGR